MTIDDDLETEFWPDPWLTASASERIEIEALEAMEFTSLDLSKAARNGVFRLTASTRKALAIAYSLYLTACESKVDAALVLRRMRGQRDQVLTKHLNDLAALAVYAVVWPSSPSEMDYCGALALVLETAHARKVPLDEIASYLETASIGR